jgi:hypothetical protein
MHRLRRCFARTGLSRIIHTQRSRTGLAPRIRHIAATLSMTTARPACGA